MSKEESMTSRELRNCVGWNVPRDKKDLQLYTNTKKKKKDFASTVSGNLSILCKTVNIAMGNIARSSLMGVIYKYVSRL